MAPCKNTVRIFNLTQIIFIFPESPDFDPWAAAGVNSFYPRVSNLHEIGLIHQEYPGGQSNKETFPIFCFKVEVGMNHQNSPFQHFSLCRNFHALFPSFYRLPIMA
jgi:hypothetical protein